MTSFHTVHFDDISFLMQILGLMLYLTSFLLFAQPLHAYQVTLNAADWDAITTGGLNGGFIDYLTLYYPIMDGFVKFDVSSIPDSAVVTSAVFSGKFCGWLSGLVRFGRTANDSWSLLNTFDPYPGINSYISDYKDLSNQIGNFQWELDINAMNWNEDLLDNYLSVVLIESRFDSVAYPPFKLKVDYSVVPEPSTLLLLGIGSMATLLLKRKRKLS